MFRTISSALLNTCRILFDVVVNEPQKFLNVTRGAGPKNTESALLSCCKFSASPITLIESVLEVPGFPQIMSGVFVRMHTQVAIKFSSKVLLRVIPAGNTFKDLKSAANTSIQYFMTSANFVESF